MKLIFSRIVLVLLVLALASCSEFNKLRKSKNDELKYQKALDYFAKKKYSRTIILLEDVAPVFVGSTKEDTIAYYYGTSLYKDGNFEASGEVFDAFRRHFSRSPFLEDVEFMYAKGFYYASPAPERDQTSTHRALIAIDEYLNRYPNSPKREEMLLDQTEMRQKLYDQALKSSRLYYDIGYYNSAVVALENALERYPQTNHREILSYLILSSHYLFARNSVEEKQRQRYQDTQDAYYSFVAEFPDSKYRKEADKMQENAKKYLARFDAKDAAKAAQAADATTEVTTQPIDKKAQRQEQKKELKDAKRDTKETKKTEKAITEQK